jgi:phage shock protein PspC (stress-responsive transcriptional regulator)
VKQKVYSWSVARARFLNNISLFFYYNRVIGLIVYITLWLENSYENIL